MSEPSANPMRRALKAMTHGVYVLSVAHESHDEYIIVSLAMQCSVEPPRIAMAVSVNSRILDVLRAARGGVLFVLEAAQIAAVRKYGTPGGVRHAADNVARSVDGHPIPPEGACWLALRIVNEMAGGDHIVFIADVVQAGAQDATIEPLTLAAGNFPYGG